MIHNLKITAVVENTAGTFDAAGEWGLALWIEAGERRILSDTGRGIRCCTTHACSESMLRPPKPWSSVTATPIIPVALPR